MKTIFLALGIALYVLIAFPFMIVFGIFYMLGYINAEEPHFS